MFMLREGSLALLTAVVAMTVGLGISRLVDTSPQRPDGQVLIHSDDGATRVADPAAVRLTARPRPETAAPLPQ